MSDTNNSNNHKNQNVNTKGRWDAVGLIGDDKVKRLEDNGLLIVNKADWLLLREHISELESSLHQTQQIHQSLESEQAYVTA